MEANGVDCHDNRGGECMLLYQNERNQSEQLKTESKCVIKDSSAKHCNGDGDGWNGINGSNISESETEKCELVRKAAVKVNGESENTAEEKDAEEELGKERPTEDTEWKAETTEDAYYVYDTGLTIKIVAPGAEPFEIQVSSSDIVQELHQLLMETEETCHRTCFSLQLDGVVLDNFAELKSIAGLKDGSVIKVVEELYTCREAWIHVKHVRDLLKPSDWADAYGGTDCASLSFLNTVSGGDLSGKERVVDCTPPECIMPGTSNSLLLTQIHPYNEEQEPISCLKVLAASGWNPPPGYRKLHGDLVYLLLITLEDKTCHLTASPRGFYLNRSTLEVFDPLPAHTNNYLSHSLIKLLGQVSPAFRKSFSQLRKRRKGRHPFERVATPYQVYSWVSPTIAHHMDVIRAEQEFSPNLGYEEPILGILGRTRDWNEELQSTRELPRSTLRERLLRERAIFTVHSDFVSAATRGAVAVIDGNIMAINPGETHKMQKMFIWSNIFFSLGFDVGDHYKELGGDAAAHVAPRNDLQGVAAYSAIDLEGLYTLATVVIDYKGYRVTAQSIIPGILEREPDQLVVYGSIDFGKAVVVTNTKYLELLKKAAPRLTVFPHYVLNEKNEMVELCSSVECKGIIGNDGRHYILDLLRTFPPDVNFLKEANIELTDDAKEMGYPLEHPHKLCCLRQELVDAFVESRYVTFIDVAAYHLQMFGFKAQTVDERKRQGVKALEVGGQGNQDGENKETTRTSDEDDCNSNLEFVENMTKSPDMTEAIRIAARAICSLSPTEFDIRFNPNLFSPNVKHAEPDDVVESPEETDNASNDSADEKPKDQYRPKKYPSLAAQIRLNKEACEYLLLVQIPTFVRDTTASTSCALETGSTFFGPNALLMDGASLSAAMHMRGINIRYLGRIVSLLLEKENQKEQESKVVVIPNGQNGQTNGTRPHQIPHFMTAIAVMELISRSAKHIFNPFIEDVNVLNQSFAISHFLNCMLMVGSPTLPPAYNHELFPSAKARRGPWSKNGQNKGKHSIANDSLNEMEWTALTGNTLWEQMKKDMSSYYGFTFPINVQDSLGSALSVYGIQRISLLRSFCLKTGIQILLREYQFNRGSASGKSNTFTHQDILNVFPVVKHIDPKASDANAFLAIAQNKLSAGFFREGYELLNEALILLNNVYGVMHSDVALCLRSLARLNYAMGEHANAMACQQKALFLAERLLGVDHPMTILDYTHLSLYCFANNQVTTALNLLYRARYLSILVCGENHPHIALLDSNTGLILHSVGEYELSLKFLEKALDLSKKYFGGRSLKTAVAHHLVARTQTCIGDFRSALMNERQTYSIYKEQLGEKHERTQEASDCLQHLTQQAVFLQRKINDLAHGKGLPPMPIQIIQPPSMGSVLEMLNLINGILFMKISQQDIENFKAELEQRAHERSPNDSHPSK